MMASDVPASVSAPAAFTAPSATIALPGQAASLTAPDGRVVVDLESLRISPAEGTRYRLTMGRRGSARRVTVATFGRWAELGWAPRGHSFFLTQGLASDRSDCLVVAPRRGRMSTLSLTSVVRGQPGPLTAAERPSTSHFYLECDHWAGRHVIAGSVYGHVEAPARSFCAPFRYDVRTGHVSWGLMGGQTGELDQSCPDDAG